MLLEKIKQRADGKHWPQASQRGIHKERLGDHHLSPISTASVPVCHGKRLSLLWHCQVCLLRPTLEVQTVSCESDEQFRGGDLKLLPLCPPWWVEERAFPCIHHIPVSFQSSHVLFLQFLLDPTSLPPPSASSTPPHIREEQGPFNQLSKGSDPFTEFPVLGDDSRYPHTTLPTNETKVIFFFSYETYYECYYCLRGHSLASHEESVSHLFTWLRPRP